MFDVTIHENYMKKILHWIFGSKVEDSLWFKWWTLSYFCYNLDRFSTDIDIDIIDLDKEKEVVEIVRGILHELWDVKNETLGKCYIDEYFVMMKKVWISKLN